MMDILFYFANYLHALAVIVLLLKIWCTHNCSGISGKSQFLLALVFTTRYLDVFTTFISTENTVLKVLFTIVAYCTVLSIYFFFRKSYERKYDIFRIEMLIIPCLALAMFINHQFTAIEVLWAFSSYLEAVAMVPQFVFISKAKLFHKHVLCYILAHGIYKGLYIVHWIWRYYVEEHYDKLAIVGGVIHFILYVDFFARVVPYVKSYSGSSEEQQPQQGASSIGEGIQGVEDGLAEARAGHLNGNISTIVLTPDTLLNFNTDKVNLLKAEDAN